MDWLSVAVHVGRIAALVALISASIKRNYDFEYLSSSKSTWIVINVLGLVIPYLGLLTASAYVLCIFRHGSAGKRPITVRVRDPGEPAPARPRSQQRPARYSSGGSYQSRWPNSPRSAGRVPCGVCNTRGWHYSDGQGNKMTCYACGGSGYLS